MSESSLSAAVGALDSIMLKGKRYSIGELTIGDFADYEQHARELIKVEKKEKLDSALLLYGVGSIPDSIASECLSAPTNAEIESKQGTLSGTVFLFHRALQKGQAGITVEQVRDMVHLSDLTEILEKIGAGDSDQKNEGKTVKVPNR